MQEGKVIAYESRKLKEHEQNFFAYDLELAAIIHALKMWRHYLMGRKFLLLTDHHSLTNYFSQPALNARQARWVDFLITFDFDIKHLQGKENRVADALSRKVQNLYEISLNSWKSSLFEIIQKAAEQDAEYQQIKQQLQQTNSEEGQQEFELDNAGLLQPLAIPEWKWETISMDFITGLPKTKRNNDSIMVVVDKLSKAAHFIPVQSTYKAAQIAHIFMQNVFKLHGLPKTIISDRDVKFTLAFWRTLFFELGTQLNFSTAYHPQTDGQTERVNQVVEDMLRAYVMQQPMLWEVEFTYNNGYHTSTQLSHFEVLYGRKCRTPSNWGGPEDRLILAPDMLKEMEDMVKRVRANLKVFQDRQKKFVDRKRRFKEYQVGDHVYIKIQAKRSTLQWSGCAKLAPRYCGPFQVLARIGPVAYQLALPSHIRVHNVFHVEPEAEVLVEPLNILDWREVQLQKRVITQVKVQWRHYGPDEATCEDEALMIRNYPGLFVAGRHRDDVES
eukprot:PITA_32874